MPPDVLEQEADHHEQQPLCYISCRGRNHCLLRETVARFDAEALAVVLTSLMRCVDERCVNGVAVTRHAVLDVPTVLVGAFDVDREFDGPAVTV
jgi:hypothetical protein